MPVGWYYANLSQSQAVCSEPSLTHIEKMHWLEKNVLVAASRVLKHTAAEKGKSRAESMLHVCGDLIDLDTACLTVKILRHVSVWWGVISIGLGCVTTGYWGQFIRDRFEFA